MIDSQLMPLVSGTIAGTTLMTLFGLWVSQVRNREFAEPVLLNRFLCRKGLIREYQLQKHPAGWLIHYIVGLVFLFSYYVIWTHTSYAPTLSSAIILGCMSGLAGILGWIILFHKMAPPPNLNVREYYFQLFIAHIIFALTTFVFQVTQPSRGPNSTVVVKTQQSPHQHIAKK